MSKICRLGFIVNPIAGMGGAVGLKGTDGEEILRKAIMLGAKPIAPKRAKEFLSELKPLKDKIHLITAAGVMGEEEALECNFNPEILGVKKEKTTAEDTKEAAKKMVSMEVDLLVFCGGDGTARDILDVVDMKIPVLGVPTGVKMHSAVFAVNPKAAARIAIRFLWGELPLKEAEVMDVDEEAFRMGRVSARLYGYMMIPYEADLVQGAKAPSPISEDEEENKYAIAKYVVEMMEPNTIYILGPGTTTKPIADILKLEKTLLGVDLVCNGKLLASDVNEQKIIEAISGRKAKIIVTPIGGQGFIFGRGNQQISPKVIRMVGKENIIVIATKSKIRSLKNLRVDTGDSELDEELKGFIRVIIDYGEEMVVKVK